MAARSQSISKHNTRFHLSSLCLRFLIVGFLLALKLSDSSLLANTVPTNLRITAGLSIDENLPVGTIVGHFSADDADGDELSFAMGEDIHGTHNGYFTMDSNGTLRTGVELDYELDNTYSLRVQIKAMDAHGGEVSNYFDVTYNNVNELPNGDVTINGNAEFGDTLVASQNLNSDPDGTINASNAKWYEYNPSGDDYTGSSLKNGNNITLNEAHIGMRLVAVFTYSDGVHNNNKAVSSPTDVINGPPVGLNSSVPLILAENDSPGVIGQIIATDPNGDPITYSLVSGTGDMHNHLFELESNGRLSILGSVDYETHSSLAIRVRASDDKGSIVEQDIPINVTNIDESPTGSVDISGTPEVGQTLVASNTLTDPDGMGSITYDWSLNGNFHTTAASLALDQSMAGSYVTVSANYSDNGGFVEQVISSQTVPINTPPSSLAVGVGLEVNENNLVGSDVGLLSAVDLDGDTLTYTLVSGVGDSHNSLFHLDANGSLTAPYTFDYESTDSYSIRVRVDDGRGASIEEVFAVQVNNINEEPLGSLTITGNPMLGETLSVVSGLSDPDGMGTIICSWYKLGDDFTDSNRLATGANCPLEEEVVNCQLVAVAHYTDGGGYEEEVVSTPSAIINGPPTWLEDASQISVIENQSSNVIVGSLVATDPNNDPILYSLVSGTGDDNNSIFQLDSSGSLKILTTLDREIWPTLSIRVKADDGNGGILESAISIEVGNIVEDYDGDGEEDYFDEDDDGDGFSDLIELAYPSDPMDAQSLATQNPFDLEALNEMSIIAGQPEGTLIGRFTAKEPDGEDISFSLVGDNNSDLVKISPNGDLLVGSNSLIAGTGVVEIKVRASDPWGAFVEKEFELMGFSDPSEAISGYLGLEESVSVGTAIGSFATVDDGNESDQSYEQAFMGGSGDDAFDVSVEGLLKVAQPLDYETLSTYYVGVRVTDSDGGIRVQYFGISLLNESPALVDTLAPATSSADSVVLRGTITDPGCVNGVDQVGFLISKDPIVEFEQDGVNKFMVEVDENGTSFDFTHQITDNEEIYYRAYAINVEGVSMSLEETFTPEKVFQPHSIFAATKKTGGGDWWKSNWFGEFYGDPENGWIYHYAHGWVFAMPSPNEGVWLWFDDLGWLWTSSDIHPFLYSEEKKNWLFIGLQSGQQNLFYDYENEDWLQRATLTIYPQK